MFTGDSSFAPTRWSVVARAGSTQQPVAREALDELCRAYWWPLYVYLRARGLHADAAADAVQGLFTELIEKRRFAHADPERGRFRAWLLAALEFHLSHERAREQTVKRGGRARFESFDPDAADRRWSVIAVHADDPERVYERAWAIAILERALDVVARENAHEDRAGLLAELEPSLAGELPPGAFAVIAARHGLTPATVRMFAARQRIRFELALRAELADTLDQGLDVDAELRSLFAALGR